MSANEYYNNGRYGSSPSPQPTGGRHPQYDNQPAPPYSSQMHLGPDDRTFQNAPPAPLPKNSPFDTVFDDHVYPAQTPSSSQHQLSQQDTGYQSLARVSSEDMAYNHPADDIPFRIRIETVLRNITPACRITFMMRRRRSSSSNSPGEIRERFDSAS